jgi:hypothetical protein
LLADGDFVPGLKHLFEIAIHGMIRQAGKWDRIAAAFAAAGQHQSQHARNRPRILMEGFVKIAHTKKQHRIRVLLLKMVELLHRRRQFFFRFRHSGRLYRTYRNSQPVSYIRLKNCSLVFVTIWAKSSMLTP